MVSSLLAVATAQRCGQRAATTRQLNHSSRAPHTHTDLICAAPFATCMWREAQGAINGERLQARGATPIAKVAVLPHLSLSFPIPRRWKLALTTWTMIPRAPHGLALCCNPYVNFRRAKKV